jgi:uncharacterized membrane protein YfcA
LGLIGGGGSILAVPVLVYLFLLDETLATGYSLFVVGCSALVGGYKQYLKGHVDLKTAIIFGTPAILSVTLVRSFLMPIIPDELFNIGTLTISRRMGILGLFALVMIPAAMAMLKTSKPNQIKTHSKAQQNNYVIIIIEGLIIGAITGMVGAGGGFLIIPALVLLAKLDIKKAIGTSLVIVTLKSLTGFFLGDALTMTINWPFLLSFTSIAIVGIVVGTRLNSLINSSKLRKGFGYFILVMAAFILYMEFA